MNINYLPTLNAALNTISMILLITGFIKIKQGQRDWHKKLMLTALGTSLMFLTSYIIYHFKVGEIKYPYYDWTRVFYFSILIPHIILAIFLGPLVMILLRMALLEQYDRHKRLARWVWPIWLFVSVSGIVIYFMLFHLPTFRG